MRTSAGKVAACLFAVALLAQPSFGKTAKKGEAKRKDGAAASGACANNPELLERFDAMGYCPKKSVTSAGIVGNELSPAQCSNIADGLDSACSDEDKKNAPKFGGAVKTVCCHYLKGDTMEIKLTGSRLDVYMNIDSMTSPYDSVKCALYDRLGVKMPVSVKDGSRCATQKYKVLK